MALPGTVGFVVTLPGVGTPGFPELRAEAFMATK